MQAMRRDVALGTEADGPLLEVTSRQSYLGSWGSGKAKTMVIEEADYLAICRGGHRSFLRLRWFDPETMLGRCTKCGQPARCYVQRTRISH